MTLIVLLLLGGGAVFILSAFTTDPATGHSESVVKTIADVWSDRVLVASPPQATNSTPSDSGSSSEPAGTRASDTGSGPGRRAVPVGLTGNAATAAYLASHRL